MQITYPTGTLCLRCGVEKKDKMKGCWGKETNTTHRLFKVEKEIIGIDKQEI